MIAVLVIVGAAVGAPTRYLMDLFVQGRHASPMPWGTIAVNATGSLVIGTLAGVTAAVGENAALTALVGTGFCGALTTFSTFSYETVMLLEAKRATAALANVVISLLVGLPLCFGGYAVAVYLAGNS